MKVVLFERDKSFLSRLTSIITGSSFTHAGVILTIDGYCFYTDSAFKTSGIRSVPLNQLPDYLKTRNTIIFDLGYSEYLEREAIIKMNNLVGTRYDYLGAMFWAVAYRLKKLGLSVFNRRLYCFEYALELLNSYHKVPVELLAAPNGNDLFELLSSKPRSYNLGC